MTATALTVVPPLQICKAWLDRSGGGRPRLRVNSRVGDYITDIRTSPQLSIRSLLAIGPSLAPIREQVNREMADRRIYRPTPCLIEPQPLPASCFSFSLPVLSDRLGRLDNDTLELVNAEIEGVTWAYRAMALIHTHFPDVLPTLSLALFSGWWDIFTLFYRLVQAEGDWFPLNQPLIDHLWESWKEGSDPRHLAGFLTEIPLEVFGIGPQEERDYPVFIILYDLLTGKRQPPQSYGPDLSEIINDIQMAHPELFDRDRILYERVKRADMSGLTPPLNYLRSVAEVVMAGEAGNPFLSTYFDYDYLCTSRHFYWDVDVPRLKEAWVEVRPIAEEYTAFKRWFTGDAYDRYWQGGQPLREEQKIYEVISAILTRSEEGRVMS